MEFYFILVVLVGVLLRYEVSLQISVIVLRGIGVFLILLLNRPSVSGRLIQLSGVLLHNARFQHLRRVGYDETNLCTGKNLETMRDAYGRKGN